MQYPFGLKEDICSCAAVFPQLFYSDTSHNFSWFLTTYINYLAFEKLSTNTYGFKTPSILALKALKQKNSHLPQSKPLSVLLFHILKEYPYTASSWFVNFLR